MRNQVEQMSNEEFAYQKARSELLDSVLVNDPRDQPTTDATGPVVGEAESLEHQVVVLAARAARTEALLDAEKAVRDMAAEPRRWAAEARLLRLAADKIGRLK